MCEASLNLLLVWVSTNLRSHSERRAWWISGATHPRLTSENSIDTDGSKISDRLHLQNDSGWYPQPWTPLLLLSRLWSEKKREGGEAGNRPSDKYTAGDICEQPSEWEKQSDTSTVSQWHLISVDSSSWTRGDLWWGRKAQRQCQIDVMIIHILPSAHFRSAKDKLKEKYRCLTTLKLSFFQVSRNKTSNKRRNIYELMFGGWARWHDGACVIIRTYPLLWNCLLPVKLMRGIWTVTGGAPYNCNFPPAVLQRGRGHEKNKWRGDESRHPSWHGLKDTGGGSRW